jgi:hypothetical protein
LHAQHHAHNVLETRKVPGVFTPPAMTSIRDFALSKNVWEYDVLDHFPFATDQARKLAEEAKGVTAKPANQ